MIEKTAEQWTCADYSLLKEQMDILQFCLRRKGHTVNLAINLETVIDSQYSSADFVIAHPPLGQFRRLYDLHTRYPHVGLIISPGMTSGVKECSSVFSDCSSIQILEKPYPFECLLSSIEEAVSFARSKPLTSS